MAGSSSERVARPPGSPKKSPLRIWLLHSGVVLGRGDGGPSGSEAHVALKPPVTPPKRRFRLMEPSISVGFFEALPAETLNCCGFF